MVPHVFALAAMSQKYILADWLGSTALQNDPRFLCVALNLTCWLSAISGVKLCEAAPWCAMF